MSQNPIPTPESKVILIDMDNTILDLDAQLFRALDMIYPDNAFRNKTTFDFDDPAIDKVARAFMTQKGFFLGFDPYPGAIDAIKCMAEKHNVYFVTSPLTEHKFCVSEKYQWIEMNFGLEWTKKIIVTKDKTLVMGDYLIDDKPQVEGIMVPRWEHIYFTQPYNTMYNKRRIGSWEEWSTIFDNRNEPEVSKSTPSKRSYVPDAKELKRYPMLCGGCRQPGHTAGGCPDKPFCNSP